MIYQIYKFYRNQRITRIGSIGISTFYNCIEKLFSFQSYCEIINLNDIHIFIRIKLLVNWKINIFNEWRKISRISQLPTTDKNIQIRAFAEPLQKPDNQRTRVPRFSLVFARFPRVGALRVLSVTGRLRATESFFAGIYGGMDISRARRLS